MSMKKNFEKICLFLFTLVPFAFGQPFELKSRHLYVDDGLPHTNVRDIIQDSQGFLWFGTEHGLARYDGYNIRTFLAESDNPNGLSGASITTLHKDSNGTIWIG